MARSLASTAKTLLKSLLKAGARKGFVVLEDGDGNEAVCLHGNRKLIMDRT